MYFIKVKGRGYFSGIKSSRKYPDWNDNPYIMQDTYTPIFKRDSCNVNSDFIYHTEEVAKTALEALKSSGKYVYGIKDVSEEKTRQRYVGGYRKQEQYIYTERSISTKVFTVLEKMEVVSCDEFMVTKKTHLPHNKTTLKIYKSDEDGSNICDYCRMLLLKDEPYLQIPPKKGHRSTIICHNCLQSIGDQVESEYKQHRDAEAITTAWTMERISNEI